MSDSKRCPSCRFVNGGMNLVCVKCETSLIDEAFLPSYSERFADQPHERNYFLEELLSPTMLVCAPLAVFFALMAILVIGSPLTPLFFAASIILGAMPFFPGDPVGEYIRLRLEQRARGQLPKGRG